MALMVFSDSEVYNDKTSTKTCLKNYETLKKQCDDLIVKLNQTEFTAATYKRGLATVEEQLITYRKNEVLFSEEVAVLKREVACKDYEINVLKKSQITDKSKKGLGYDVVPPLHPLIYNRPKNIDLSYSGLDEFKDPEFKSYGSEERTVNIAHPKSIVFSAKPMLRFSKIAQSTIKRPFQSKTVLSNKRFTHKVNVAKAQVVNTARPKAVKTARLNSAVVNAVSVNQANVVKTSAC
ncbi:hypothetical protein Tco_1467289 [Tanacetum coccineum]